MPVPASQKLPNCEIIEKIPLPPPPADTCKSLFSRVFSALNVETGQKFDINCGSWRCPVHRKQWGKKWGAIVAKACENHPNLLLVNLTTAGMCDNKQIATALRSFIRKMRNAYGWLEYIKVVEYNKKHTQPHFHLIISFETWKWGKQPGQIADKESWPEPLHNSIKEFWQASLKSAAPHVPLSWVTWCQQPKGDSPAAAAKYAVKYAVAENDKAKEKNEEPDETWKGRKITFSKGFLFQSAKQIWNDILDVWFPDRHKNQGPTALIFNDNITPFDEISIPNLLSRRVKERLNLADVEAHEAGLARKIRYWYAFASNAPPAAPLTWQDVFGQAS